MTIADQLKQLRQNATEWLKKYPGAVALAASLDELLTQLALQTPPGRVAVSILFHREDKHGEYEETGVVDRYFWIAITMGKGMKADASARLTDGAAGGAPLYEVAESFRDDVIRSMSFNAETTVVTPDYKGMEPLTVNNQTYTDALKLEFCIVTQMPAIQPQ